MWPWLKSDTSISKVLTTFTQYAYIIPMEEMTATELNKMLHLTVNEDNTVQVPKNVWQENEIDFNLCLVGRVLSRK